MSLAKRLRNMVDGLRDVPGAAVTLPVDTLVDWLENEAGGDLTLEAWAAAYAPEDPPAVSTVREWFAGGLVPGAYKRNGRKWMAPPESVADFRRRQQERHAASRTAQRTSRALGRGQRPDTSAWRNV